MSDAETGWLIDVDETNFERDVVERSENTPVIVDFWASWCQPCLTLGPLLERLVGEHEGHLVLAKVNIDTTPNLAANLAISSIPVVMAVRDGAIVSSFVGLQPEAEIRKFIESVLPSEADTTAEDAAHIEREDPKRAAELYRNALSLDDTNETAKIGLVRSLIAQDLPEATAEAKQLADTLMDGGDQREAIQRLRALLFFRELAAELEDAADLRKRLSTEPTNNELRYTLGCALATQGAYPDALEVLLEAAAGDKQLAREKVREVMVKIFYIVGARSELADEYRGKLSRLLY